MAERTERPIAGNILRDLHETDGRRLIALEIRLNNIGFAVFEGQTKLLDWGVGIRWFGKNRLSLRLTPSNRLHALMLLYRPTVVVARRINHCTATANKRFATILRAIRAECRRNSAEFNVIPIRQVQRHFVLLGLTTKYDVAASLAERFDGLSWKLPKPKKSYQSEARAMLIFDAAATGVAFLEGTASKNGDLQVSS